MVSFKIDPRFTGAFWKYVQALVVTFIVLFLILCTALKNRLNKSKPLLVRKPTKGFLRQKSRFADEEADNLGITQQLCFHGCCPKSKEQKCRCGSIKFMLRPFQLLAEWFAVLFLLQVFRDDINRTYPNDDLSKKTEDNYINSWADPNSFFAFFLSYFFLYQIISAFMTFGMEFHTPLKGIRSAAAQFLGIRGILQMYTEVYENEDSIQMLEYATLQALFFSWPMLLLITIYAFEAFREDSQGSWYALMYCLIFFSTINLARAKNYVDKFGMIHATPFQNGMLVIWRMCEIFIRIHILALFASYFNKTVTMIWVVCVNIVLLVVQVQRKTRCFRAQRKENDIQVKSSGKNDIQRFVEICQNTFFYYIFVDPLHSGYGWYMNWFKILESVAMFGIICFKNAYPFPVFFKPHDDVDLGLFLTLRIAPGVAGLIITTLYFKYSGNFDMRRYKECVNKQVDTLVKVRAWSEIRMLIERRHIETLTQKNADIIFEKLSRTEFVEKLRKRLRFTITDLCRLRVPMEYITLQIYWSHMKNPSVRKFKKKLGIVEEVEETTLAAGEKAKSPAADVEDQIVSLEETIMGKQTFHNIKKIRLQVYFGVTIFISLHFLELLHSQSYHKG